MPIYEAIETSNSGVGTLQKARHHGVYCDGPLCNAGIVSSSYIVGDRYKCAVCHDTDFCAHCEASPSNQHNKTHPLVKFKTMIRNVSVTTMADGDSGRRLPVMGDRHTHTSKSTGTTPTQTINAATQVQTVVDLQPTESSSPPKETSKLLKSEDAPAVLANVEDEKAKAELVAHFVRDTIADGTTIAPNTCFEQTWFLRNDGTTSWPAGCSVRFVAGDNMCAIDPQHPASVLELVNAAETNTCHTEVAPGQEIGFTVLMRAPARSGKVISYWRLTGPTDFKFGHKLWCHIEVAPAEVAIKEEEDVKDIKSEESSQMIFPKLDKEPPATSMHEEASPSQEEELGTDQENDYVYDDEDLDSVSGTEDGFLTDDEYDILDASDDDYLTQVAKK